MVVEVGLDVAEGRRQRLDSILDDDERARAARFVFPHDGRRYVAAHAALRLVLAHYLDEDPRRLRFERGTHGKPRLACRTAGDYEINLSHSGGRALIAVARAREVGVDIEVTGPASISTPSAGTCCRRRSSARSPRCPPQTGAPPFSARGRARSPS